MNWLTDFVRPKIKKVTPKEIADNLWVKCPICGQMLFSKEMKKSLYVCTSCGHHLRLYVDKRLKMLFDGEFNEIALPKVKEDPLKFKDTKDIPTVLRLIANQPKAMTPSVLPRATSAAFPASSPQWISLLWAALWEWPSARE